MRNAIRLAVVHRAIDAHQASAQLKQIESDLKDELLLTHLNIDWTDVLRKAEKLGAAYNQKIGCRSADLFHIAAASTCGYDTLFTFDEKQAALARAAGLSVQP